MKGSDNPFPSVLLLEETVPATPPAGRYRLFAQGGVIKLVDESGTVHEPGEISDAEMASLQDQINALSVTVDGKAAYSHTQPSTTITDFTEAVQDVLAATLVGSGVTVSYNDAAGTVTITGLASTDTEAVRDAIGVALVGVGAITVLVNDAADTITISTTATDRATHTGTQVSTTISDLAETVQDIVGAMVVAGANITKTYDDTAGTLTIAGAAGGGGGGAYRGAFNASTDYSTGDIVTHIGCTWIATSDTTTTPALPTGVFTDTFNRADSATVGWTVEDAMWAISGNKMVSTADGGEKWLLQSVGANNGTLTFDGFTTSVFDTWTEAGMVIRYSDVNNYLTLRWQHGTTAGLYKMVGGTETLIGNIGAVGAGPGTLSVTFIGTNISGSWNGVPFSFSAADGVPAPAGSAIGVRQRYAFGATTITVDNVVFTPSGSTGWGLLEKPSADVSHFHTGADVTDLTESVQDIVAAYVVAGANITKTYDDTANTLTISGTGSGSGSTSPGIFRGAWSSLAVVATYPLTAPGDLSAFGATISNATFVSTPAGVNPPGQGTVLSIGPTATANLNFTIPTGVTKIRWYAKVDDGSWDAAQEIRVNGAVAGGWQTTDWTLFEWNVSPGNAITINNQASFGAWGTWWVGSMQFLGPNGSPYMAGEYVIHIGKLWVSLSNNNSGTPGTSGWQEVPLAAKVPIVWGDGRPVLSTSVGTMRVPNASGRPQVITAVRVDVGTAPTGGPLIVDVNKNGATIFTTQANRPSVAAGAFAASSGTINQSAFAAGDTLTVDIDQVGSTVPGGYMTVTIFVEG